MRCPNCGTIEQGRIRVCPKCNFAYASEDLLELHQLEYLLSETATWPEADIRGKKYAERLAVLKARISPVPIMSAEAEKLPQAVQRIEAHPDKTLAIPTPARQKSESVPFDQWLLSERNIKIALYSGGALLVIAGLIFVSVNWARIPGLLKFAVTLLITGLMYLGGYLLYRRPALKIGGIALLAISCGFIPLNFVVLQIYIFGVQGMSENVMWLIGSLVTLLLYALTTAWTRVSLFTYFCVAALVSVFTAALVLLDAAFLVYFFVYAVLSILLLLGAIVVRQTRFSGFTYTPLLIVSQISMPLLFIASAGFWIFEQGCPKCVEGSPWLAITTMIVGVVFYIITDLSFRWLFARWVATFGFAVTFMFILAQLTLSSTTIGIILMVFALVYLLGGIALEKRIGKKSAAWPLYAAGYAVAVFVTFQSLIDFGEDPGDLALTLTVDAILLAISAWIHQQYYWIYGATWLFIAPVYIYASMVLDGLPYRGVVLWVLMLIYSLTGYVLGRRALKLGGPFLTAAIFLSLAVVPLTWSNKIIVSIALITIAILYLLSALWRKSSWLLLPTLVAVNISLLTIVDIFYNDNSPWEETLTIAYAILGVMLSMGGAWLRQRKGIMWGWPLYLMGAIDIVGSYIYSLYLGGLIAIVLSIIFAAVMFSVAWFERENFAKIKLPPILTYLGSAFIFIGQFYVIQQSSKAWQVWPAYTICLCTLLVVISWFLKQKSAQVLFGIPLRLSGEVLMLIPLIGAVVIFKPLLIAFTYAIAALTFVLDARVRRSIRLNYLAGGAFIIVIWALLYNFQISELQAFVLPLGLGLLVIGWNERRMGGKKRYRLPTLLGLLILMGSLFYQSLTNIIYAVVLLAESLVTIAVGLRIHSRSLIQLGVLSLLINGIAQLGPGFVHLSRWIQLAIIGSILLVGGLTGLFRREKLLSTRKRITEEWSHWEV
jgi:hypothetical protein